MKKRFDELCKDFGMSANTAFNMFARTVIKLWKKLTKKFANIEKNAEQNGFKILCIFLSLQVVTKRIGYDYRCKHRNSAERAL